MSEAARRIQTGMASHTESMQADEKAIRALVDNWLEASANGDLKTLLTLMSEDVIFMVPGNEPFGKDAFIAHSNESKDIKLEGRSEIKEIKILGDWAWMRNHLKISFTPPGGETSTRSGYTLTILRRNNGKWVIARDANLMT